jgi:hypothetical protein
MRIVQPRRLSGRLSVDQAVRPVSVELENPIANDLKRYAADLGRLAARGAFVYRRQRQQTPRLRTVLRTLRCGSHHYSLKIHPKRYRHGEPPSFATLNQFKDDLGSPESYPPGLGIIDSLIRTHARRSLQRSVRRGTSASRHPRLAGSASFFEHAAKRAKMEL